MGPFANPRVPFRFSKTTGSLGLSTNGPLSEKVRSSRSSSSPVVPRTRVVTDIDDTVKSSGGLNLFGIALGGIDTQFKRGDFYPGVFQFALELSCSGARALPEKVAVLTARAREFKFALALKPKDKLCTAFREAGQKNGFSNWGIGPVYYGSVAEWIFQERKGLRKFSNFEKMMRDDTLASGLGPNASRYILVGDTGEKDEAAGEMIVKKYPSLVRAVFLHVVSSNKDRAMVTLPKDRKLNNVPIYYFRTYVGAATKAMQANLISPDALGRIIQQSRSDLRKKDPQNAPRRGENVPLVALRRRSSKWGELEEDIHQAEEEIKVRKSSRLGFAFRITRFV